MAILPLHKEASMDALNCVSKKNISVSVRANAQHGRYKNKNFDLSFDKVEVYILSILENVHAPPGDYIFYVHGKLESVELNKFSVKLLKNKVLRISLYKPQNLDPFYGTLSCSYLSEDEMIRLFKSLKTWECGEGQYFDSIYQEKDVIKDEKEVEFTKKILCKMSLDELMSMDFKDVFLISKNAKDGTPDKCHYYQAFAIAHQFGKSANAKKKILASSKNLLNNINYIFANKDYKSLILPKLLHRLMNQFSYTYKEGKTFYLEKLCQNFVLNTESFDMSVLEDSEKQKVWRVEVLIYLSKKYIPNQGKRKHIWSPEKEKEFKNLCSEYLIEDMYEIFREMYFAEGYQSLMDCAKKVSKDTLQKISEMDICLGKLDAKKSEQNAKIKQLEVELANIISERDVLVSEMISLQSKKKYFS